MTEEEYLARIRELEYEVAQLRDKLTAKIKSKKYGLVWEDVPEAFEQESENKIPILEEVKELAVKNNDGKPTHILIEGDNYHALQCLNYTHKGKIDVIYIDPPYNTGKEFVYRDKRMLEKYPDGQTIDSNHPLRHSSWLSFMSKRLRLAKELLSERGVIFISIDDNEQANLKLLCDEVFGEKNFVSQVVWHGKYTTSNDSKDISRQHEFVLVVAKSKEDMKMGLLARTEEMDAAYKNPDNDKKGVWKPTPLHAKSGSENSLYTITFPNGIIWSAPKGRFPRYTKERLLEIYNEGGLYFNKSGGVDKKTYLSEVKQGKTPGTLWKYDEVGSTHQGNEQLADIMGKGVFDNPKTIGLVQRCIQISYKDNQSSIILDFFAGSGTTMHATMKLNEEDGGNRQCILVNVNESNICREVTYERNRRVMQGYTNAKGEQVEGLGNSLKYYKTAFVGKNPPADATDEDKVALALKAGHLIAIAENTLEEIENSAYYQIFSDGERYTAIYFSGDLSGMAEFAGRVEALRNSSKLITVNVYIYCLASVSDFECEFVSLRRINLHPIPQPIIEIYKQLNA